MTVETRRVGPEAAADLYAVVRAAFEGRPPLDPPADALAETPETLEAALAAGPGGLLAYVDGEVVGGLLLDPVTTELGDLMALRRFGVVPGARHHGVAHVLIAAAVEVAREMGRTGLTVLARQELESNIGFWASNHFAEVGRHAPYVEMVRPLPVSAPAPDADAMQALAGELAGVLRAGDLLVLSGELGAGKTTFTQGLGAGLGVRGGITSPTFVIARVHPSLVDGPALVHVDAYRLGGLDELDDLDLDTSLDEAVTVVEWGAGMAEALADERLHVRITRAVGADAVPSEEDTDDPRVVEFVPVGARWLGVALPGTSPGTLPGAVAGAVADAGR
ncbi:tRNA (adenosine(37)-N6)-threonylcarbamoyltransferase complex ATPase subunit type 1 TsaE [Nocardioides jiangxiensis]|uniref:tRNA threonylcarbamoyladenosine biosynthesis protein TsaE n=1 Tax=Nocardioides jiangxiensis TaxID=3064524 RepID=A0ABT9B326_9ACTN|nr:tRNA (adenosine(37)-N6)-threonylcarbamoyltransferase complex ATPase subunit type 1 TsaE [Nocardioides sp. WY-20]MDO7868724.1 tRNA (adenosine(37)-N6)-threonylcarbamoyltransferase complex ATPase subunit type 1 TsaE [Nocardioides sp. WY-20]